MMPNSNAIAKKHTHTIGVMSESMKVWNKNNKSNGCTDRLYAKKTAT